jgi:hypothetical protein
MNSARILRRSLLAGAAYFAAVATVHTLGIKLPLLYVYYNVPSHAYQDHIIGLLAFGWAVFLLAAAGDPLHERRLTRAVLVAGAGAVAGLALINATTDFAALGAGLDTRVFWLETAGLFAYWLWLVGCWLLAEKPASRGAARS